MFGDEKLIEALKKGDELAFKEVYRQYYRMAVTIVKKNNGQEEDIEDVFQEMLFVLVKKLREKDFNLTVKLGTFVYAIIRNLWLQRLKKHTREQDVKLVPDNVKEIYEEIELKQIYEKKHELIAEVFKDLKTDCQKIIKASFYEKLSHGSIAEKLGYSNAFVRVKLHRCMEGFKTKVKQHPKFQAI